ncbi:MAG: GNAT family N-acetyltransferase [Acidimicrobiales bacterium]
MQSAVEGRRLPGWADDFPDAGDVVVARMLSRDGFPPPRREQELSGHFQVVERSSDLVVGGIGLFDAQESGVVEIGYGIVPSRQGAGYATEAVAALVSAVWTRSDLRAVVATTDSTNIASQRVLEKAGFTLTGEGAELRYRINRTAQAP